MLNRSIPGIIALVILASNTTDTVTAIGTLIGGMAAAIALIFAGVTFLLQAKASRVQMQAFESQSAELKVQQQAFQVQQSALAAQQEELRLQTGAFRVAQEEFHARQKLRKEHQARKVAAWSLRRDSAGRPLIFHNGSDAPVNMCCMWLITKYFPERPHPPTPSGVKPTAWTTVIPPHDYFQRTIGRFKNAKSPRARPPVEIVFRDLEQHYWWRDANGELRELDARQIEIFTNQYEDLPKWNLGATAQSMGALGRQGLGSPGPQADQPAP